MQLQVTEMGQGPAVIILHGLYGSGRNWFGMAKKLATDYQVILPDLRNHGDSPWDDQIDYSSMATDLAELVAEKGYQRPVVVGHSMGGKVAMQWALSQQPDLAGLMLVDIGIQAYEPAYHQGILQALQSLDLQALTSRSAAEQALSAAIPEKDVRQFLLTNLVREPDGFRWRINLAALSRHLSEIVGSLPATGTFSQCSVLFLRGALSDYLPLSQEAAVRQLFPHCQIETMEGAGHWVQADQPEAFYRRLVTFLEGG